MHTLDWLSKRGRILRGAIQPIKGVHFYRCLFRSGYWGLCDRAVSSCNFYSEWLAVPVSLSFSLVHIVTSPYFQMKSGCFSTELVRWVTLNEF